jgi:membrane protein required for colicin V production
MTALDIIVIFLVGGGALLGAVRGFSTEMLALLAWVAAIAALKILYAPARDMLGGGASAAVIAFLLVAAVPFFGVKLAAGSIGGSVKRSVLGPLDRGLGFGFGALKGLLVATLGFLLFSIGYDTLFGGDSARPEWLRSSRSHMLLDASSRAIVDFVEARRKPDKPGATQGST